MVSRDGGSDEGNREGDERDIGVGEELPHTVALVRFRIAP